MNNKDFSNNLEDRLKPPLEKFSWRYSIIKDNFIKSITDTKNHVRNTSISNNLEINQDDTADYNKSDMDLSIEFLSLENGNFILFINSFHL
jgi:hypothetical protein